MKDTRTTRRRIHYAHFAELFSAIALICFAEKVHMLDGTVDPKWWGYCTLISMIGLSIISIENLSKLVAIAKAAYNRHMAEIAAEEAARKKRGEIVCYICNTKKRLYK